MEIQKYIQYFPSDKNIEAYNKIYSFYENYKKDKNRKDLEKFYLWNLNLLQYCRGYPFELFLSIFDERDKIEIKKIISCFEYVFQSLDLLDFKYGPGRREAYYLRFGERWRIGFYQ